MSEIITQDIISCSEGLHLNVKIAKLLGWTGIIHTDQDTNKPGRRYGFPPHYIQNIDEKQEVPNWSQNINLCIDNLLQLKIKTLDINFSKIRQSFYVKILTKKLDIRTKHKNLATALAQALGILILKGT